MSHRSRTYAVALTIFSGGLMFVLDTRPAVKAQPRVDPTTTFAERFSLESRVIPTFTRPEIQQFLSSLQPPGVTEGSGAPTDVRKAETQPRPQITFAQPK